MKRFLIFLGILFSSVFITGNVNASEISQLCDYTDPIFTRKDLDNIIKNNNIDTSVYDNYFIVFNEWHSSNVTYYSMSLYLFKNSDINNIYILYDSSKKSYEFWSNPSVGLYYKNIDSSNKKIDINSYNLDMNFYNNWSMNGFINSLTQSYIYYSNIDLKDRAGNVIFKANAIDDIVKNYNVNFHLNNGIAIDTYQSDIELQNIKNEMINSWTLYDTYKDKKSIMNDFNNLFLSPNLNDFTKFSNRYVTISNVSELKQIYMKVINKEYAQPIYYYEDFTINIKSNELEERLKKITITKENMSFKGLYYDDNYQNNVKENYIINSDVDLYAKYDYENVDDFLKDNTFKSYTFDENYAYAFISIGKNVGQDVYLGLDFLNYSIEIYKYDKTELKANKGSSFCLTPYFSKDNKYYYRLETINNDYYNVLVLPREKLITEENGIFTTHYNFLLTDNATVTYTNDLKQGEIVDDTGNKITIDIEDSYNYSQEAFLKDTDDLLTIFKNLLKNKDNNVFQYFEQVWQFLKRSKIFIYLNILIIGALIILIIKAANRR